MYYGIIVMLPFILSESGHTDKIFGSDDLSKITVNVLVEILGGITAALIIEIKGLGRVNNMITCYFI